MFSFVGSQMEKNLPQGGFYLKCHPYLTQMMFSKTLHFRIDAGMSFDFGAVGMECMYFAWKKDMNLGDREQNVIF